MSYKFEEALELLKAGTCDFIRPIAYHGEKGKLRLEERGYLSEVLVWADGEEAVLPISYYFGEWELLDKEREVTMDVSFVEAIKNIILKDIATRGNIYKAIKYSMEK